MKFRSELGTRIRDLVQQKPPDYTPVVSKLHVTFERAFKAIFYLVFERKWQNYNRVESSRSALGVNFSSSVNNSSESKVSNILQISVAYLTSPGVGVCWFRHRIFRNEMGSFYFNTFHPI